jgi:light-regulated signal transduction histidine kinase (bacteriophytochrome)
MVDNLLVVIRLGQTEIRREPIHMKNLVTNVLAPLLAQYPAAHVTVGEMPAAQADAALVRQLLGIVLENALRFSAQSPAPRVETGWDATHHAWFVRDNGVGFDMRYADRLWGLFERLHGPEFAQGLGIGLTIADRIVQCHGGDIWAVSAPGEGATFFFTLNPA